jgi:flagellar hook-associated protein 1 FlgK
MGTFGGIVNAATRSLSSYSEALDVIQTNIANAATPGYARQRPVLTPIVAPRGLENLGVGIGQVQSLRYRLLDFQVFQANQAKSFFGKKTQILAQTEQYVRLSGTGSVGATVNEFFGSVSALAVSPLDFTLRRAVLASGDHLARSLRTAFSGVATQRVDLDADARSTVAHINTLIERVA